jgi:hypothetical protein
MYAYLFQWICAADSWVAIRVSAIVDVGALAL